MNTGIADGHNLGWKLGLGVPGLGCTRRLLDSYQDERGPVGAAQCVAVHGEQDRRLC